MNDRSVDRWRNYNLDYNLLKHRIKVATMDYPLSGTSTVSSRSTVTNTLSSSSNAEEYNDHQLPPYQKKQIRKLYLETKDQIQFVSLFVNSKYGEISRRIIGARRQLDSIIDTDDNSNADSPVYRRIQRRKLFTIQQQLEQISTDLQDLSRFILLQKIALRKLFKKFLKYSNYTYKHELVDKIVSESLQGAPDSFVNLDLSDAASELSLMFDVIDTYCSPSVPGTQVESSSQTEIKKLGYQTTVTRMLQPPSSKRPTKTQSKVLKSKAVAFDILSEKKAPISLTFWVHKDNLNEIQFYLLRQFKMISDDTGIEGDLESPHNSVHHLHLKNTASSKNLALKHKQDSQREASNHPHDDVFHPDTQVIKYWLANLSLPRMTKNRSVENSLQTVISSSNHDDITDETTVYPCDVMPEVIYYDKSNSPILVAPVGGLRQFTLAGVNQSLLNQLFTRKEGGKELVKNWQCANLLGNPSMAKLTLDWCYENNVLPLAKIRSDRVRFVDVASNGEIKCYISLDSDIKTKSVNSSDQLSNTWTKEEDGVSDSFPHSILRVSFDSPLKALPDKVDSLINSHLVFRVDQLNFSMNNYILSKYYADSISDSLMLSFIAPWFDILWSKDIRKLPSIHHIDRHGILLNKDEVQSASNSTTATAQSHREGYWNEFDYGSDFEDNQDFYVYDNSAQENPGDGISVLGLSILTPEKVDAVIRFANKVSHLFDFFRIGDHRSDNDLESRYLLSKKRKNTKKAQNYSSINSSSGTDSNSGSDSENDYFGSSSPEHEVSEHYPTTTSGSSIDSPEFRPNELARQVMHDRVLACLYFSLTLISYLFTGAGVGIIYSVIRSINSEPGAINNNGVFMLLLFGFLCMIIALMLDLGSICLLLCRYTPAPQWHTFTVWINFFVVTSLFVVALASFF